MKNFVQEGRTVTATAAADISGGTGMLTGNLFGVACHDALNGADVEMQVNGVFDLDKDTSAGSAVTEFGPVYWNAAAGKVTGDNASGPMIGVALAAAADGDAVARVRLNGAFVETAF